MRKLSNAERKKIAIYIKNKIDISPFIEGFYLSNEDFSNAIISNTTIFNQTVKNTNFSNAIIGSKEKITVITGNTFINCNFKAAVFPHTVYFRRNKCRSCSFDEAFMPFVEYQYTDFDNACTFCDVNLRLGSRIGLGAKFGNRCLGELSKFWSVVLVDKEEYEKLLRKVLNE